MVTKTDEILVRQILEGDKRLFEEIIRRNNRRLYRLGMTLLGGDPTETEDAMQATYAKAYENLDRFEQRSSLSTWLSRIMINECLAHKKKKRRLFFLPWQNDTTPAHNPADKELQTVLEDAIGRLPEKYRLVFVLREIEDLSVRETGEALEIGEGNVKARLNRAKGMLREYLDDYMKDEVYAFHLVRCDRMVERFFARFGL